MKKFFAILLITLAVLLLGAAAWSASGYFLSMHVKTEPEFSGKDLAEVKGGDAPFLGTVVTVETKFLLPRFRKVEKCLITPGEGTVVTERPKAEVIGRSWRWNEWRVAGKLACMTPGRSKSGVLALELTPLAEGTKSAFDLAIPSLDIKALPAVTSPAPALAPASETAKQLDRRLHWLWLLLLLPAVFLWRHFRRSGPAAPPLSLRQRILGSLAALRGDIIARTLTAEQGMTSLSDLVRNYLEERYSLRAPGKTTPEFLDEVEDHELLPPKDRPFLRNFLNAADLVKFAKAPCDGPAVNTAIDNAELLVRNTAPAEEEKDV